ncbi:putative transcription factor interactor and regulator CCHC(Zn) family [Helianthus anomalus]
MKTCNKCQQAGHIRRKCPNLKPVDVEKNKRKSEFVKQKSPKFDLKQILKQKVDMLKPKQIWKPKDDMSNQNIQNDSRFYVKECFKRTNLDGKETKYLCE